MSVAASDTAFFSAIQPTTSVTTYGLPSENHLENGGSLSDEKSRTLRVQQQVKMRLAEKSTLPRQNGSSSHYAMSDYGGSSTMKYPSSGYSSKSSYMYSGSKTIGPRISQRTGFSCQSAGPDLAQLQRIAVGVGGGYGGGGGSMYREEVRMGGFQAPVRQQSRIESETYQMRQQPMTINPWMVDGSDAGSLMSERDATYSRQYAQGTMNGYGTTQMRQGGGSVTYVPTLQRSISGTMSRVGGMTGGEVEMVQQHSFKGPAHRTINRITNRNRMSMGSVSGASYVRGGDMVDRGSTCGLYSLTSPHSQSNLMMRQGTISRAMSTKSIHSVGRGMDIYGGQMERGISLGNLSGINALDMPTAVMHLRESDPDLQVLGAAYIQHECYNDNEAKNEVRRLKGIADLVKLFNSENQEVQCYATGAARNLIYENMDNKVALIEEGGIGQLTEALKDSNDELHKNITGILWNLSSKDNLKEKLARETLPDLTEKILIPLSGGGDSEELHHSPSEADIFYNTTGCLRNLSSVNEKTRQQMRQTHGLVDSLVGYIRSSLEQNKAEDKGVENAVCVLRNLSYQLYSEMPPSAMARLEGPTRDQDSERGSAIGCFTPHSRKTKNSRNQELSTFTEVARVPRGTEWLWHPQIVGLYNNLLQKCEINATTREGAAGALQNITAGDKRWASVLSRVALEQERILPVVMDLLRTTNDLELRSLTGFLRNLSRHARDKDDMSTKTVSVMVNKLPGSGEKEPSSEVVVNICGVLNNLVTCSSLAARDINYFDGIPKLIGIKESANASPGRMKAAKAASTVLSNMFQYKKLHRQYKQKGYGRMDFVDMSI